MFNHFLYTCIVLFLFVPVCCVDDFVQKLALLIINTKIAHSMNMNTFTSVNAFVAKWFMLQLFCL